MVVGFQNRTIIYMWQLMSVVLQHLQYSGMPSETVSRFSIADVRQNETELLHSRFRVDNKIVSNSSGTSRLFLGTTAKEKISMKRCRK